MSLATAIKQKLEDHNMRATDLARQGNISISIAQKIVSGHTDNPTLETLRAIARVFNCTIDELIGGPVITRSTVSKEEQDTRPWDVSLFKKIITEVDAMVAKEGKRFLFQPVIKAATAIYQYHVDKNLTDFDPEFCEWYTRLHLINEE